MKSSTTPMSLAGIQHLPISSVPRRHATARFLAMAGIVLVALNLRAAIVSLSPIYDEIGKSMAIGTTWLSVLGMLPMLCFGLVGMLAPWLNRKVGLERGMIIARLMTALGEILRAALSHDIVFFAAASAVSLGGMGIGNVLILPAIKHYFPERIGIITGIYMVMIVASASLPSLIAVPLTHAEGWRFSIGIWAVLALLAVLPWLGLVQEHTEIRHSRGASAMPRVWAWPVTWAITILFSVGAMVMYALIAWLPAILTATAGVSAATAGLMLAVYNFVGLPHSLLIPLIITKIRQVYWIILLGCLCIVAGTLGLAWLPRYAWAFIFPAGLGAMLVPVGLTLVNMRSRSEAGATALSGFVQATGYLIASLGPLLVGALHSRSGAWSLPLLFLALSGAIAAIAGLWVVRPVFIEDANGSNQP